MRALHPGRSGNKYTILHGRHESPCYGKVKNGAGANAGNWVYNAIYLRAQSENPAQTRVGAPLRARQNAGAGSTFTLNSPIGSGAWSPSKLSKTPTVSR